MKRFFWILALGAVASAAMAVSLSRAAGETAPAPAEKETR